MVVNFLTLGQGQLALDAVFFQIELEGNERLALLSSVADQAENLSFVHEQALHTERLVIEFAGGGIRSHVAVVEPSLLVLDGGIAFAEAGLAFPDGFDLGSC